MSTLINDSRDELHLISIGSVLFQFGKAFIFNIESNKSVKTLEKKNQQRELFSLCVFVVRTVYHTQYFFFLKNAVTFIYFIDNIWLVFVFQYFGGYDIHRYTLFKFTFLYYYFGDMN